MKKEKKVKTGPQNMQKNFKKGKFFFLNRQKIEKIISFKFNYPGN